jgi:hypothetical protein
MMDASRDSDASTTSVLRPMLLQREYVIYLVRYNYSASNGKEEEGV